MDQQRLMCHPWKRRRLQMKLSSTRLLYQHRQRLSRILDRLVKAHHWKEAAGVLSTLLKGYPRKNTPMDDRKNFLAAMEIQRIIGGEGAYYQTKIRKIYEAWMSKLVRMPKNIKRYSIQVEVALFYLANGNIQDALNITKILVQNPDSASEPTINLLHGMLLYQVWYSGLPEDMQIKASDFHMLSLDATSTDGYEEPENFASSNEHIAIDIEDANNPYGVASESSFGNEKSPFDHKGKVKKENNSDHGTELNISGSGLDANRCLNPCHRIYYSIFLAHGLEKSLLLPIRLDHLSGDLEHLVSLHRSLINEQYNEAVKHLKLALHSMPPLFGAMLPLVQLLLLGDNVNDALTELENCCCSSSAVLSSNAQPFRLRARILESFRINQASTICSCYEDALTKDPTCILSIEKLIKMHRIGNYDTVPLFNMIVLHLDNADGNSNIWEEFSTSFLKILTFSDVEDSVSANVSGSSPCIVSCGKLPSVFADGVVRERWEGRCRRWREQHFSKHAYVQEVQHGDWKLLASKAACASYLYGQTSPYVKAALDRLSEVGDNTWHLFLKKHLESSFSLCDRLPKD